jgi:CubicO group peptidase (beta-lactamase class C family)
MRMIRALVEQKAGAGEFLSLMIALSDGDDSAVFAFSKSGAALPDGRTVFEIVSVTKTVTGLLLA